MRGVVARGDLAGGFEGAVRQTGCGVVSVLRVASVGQAVEVHKSSYKGLWLKPGVLYWEVHWPPEVRPPRRVGGSGEVLAKPLEGCAFLSMTSGSKNHGPWSGAHLLCLCSWRRCRRTPLPPPPPRQPPSPASSTGTCRGQE